MNLPEQPAAPLRSSAGDHSWRWRLEDASGAEVTLTGDAATTYAGQTFPNQGDAESWVGEIWSELAELGVAQVTLFELDREVYGPMSLSA
ncbi:hypothetical protein ASE01_19830 [Nocardioides sp. Root190]|uniref:hypothetical protein n=1 Tax=Nocardioides sp. Root190 TaxID=1736488 RepID=UPI0006FA59A5|nr:hypothetical protein [Nocardioides sp. Root190]KRB73030.1 hypothetical protein ASE01_19830 [Nocardioides sp. Root190]